MVWAVSLLNTGVPVSGVPFANVERLPMESGSLYEVKRALRLQQFERRELMKEMRREADKMRQLRETVRAESAALSPGEGIQKKPAPGDAVPDAGPGEKPGEGIEKKPSPGGAA